ncbi:regenerating family member 4 [Phyllostomus discolor]|uniref:Regenerating family member 4 n=1 Tax=Phyllostomus discolor TaxID=89673 RepID=A0A6J2KWN9_9CHIR|nr:regenerating islet-derived protein 4 [Phyllostomus discolor]KAF6075683.1 regenerating family member 4 [Phyllostomus discolor]
MAAKSAWLLLLLSCAASTRVLGDVILLQNCPTGWFYHKLSCYGYFQKLRNWSDAELECQSFGKGAHLASIQDSKEAEVIAKVIRSYQRNLPVWIGLHDPQKNQQWRWADDTEFSFKTWSGKSVDASKHCAEISPKDDFLTWDSNECHQHQHFLCKYQPTYEP